MSVDDLLSTADKYIGLGNIGVAFTYNEPFIWFEYLLEATRALKERGLKNILVTNGYMSEEPLRALLPYIDAMNIDIKAFDKSFYQKLGGELEPVLRCAEIANADCHVEITNLLIPEMNTDEEKITMLVDWIADTLGPKTPLHFSRYFPARRFNKPPTPMADLDLARKVAERRLKSVVIGNV